MKTASMVEAYICARLDSWGREFALDKLYEPCAQTVLYLLIKFGGEIPHVEGGPAPEVVDEKAWQIERLIALMNTERPIEAAVMRAYYCGRGRHKVERRETAEMLAGVKLSTQAYFSAHDRGFAWLCGALS